MIIDWNTLFAVLGIIAGSSASVWSLAWWLSGKFSEFNKTFFSNMETMKKDILDKLEYHEQHDDKRFEAIGNNIWEIRLRQTAAEAKGRTLDRELKDENERLKDGKKKFS